MSTQSMYLRLLAGAAIVVVIAIAAMPERTVADGSDQQLAAQPLPAHAECNAGECSECQSSQTVPFQSFPQFTNNTPRFFRYNPTPPPPTSVPQYAPQYSAPANSAPQMIQSSPSPYPAASPPTSFVQPASASQNAPQFPGAAMSPAYPSSGIPAGSFTNETPLGNVKLTVKGNRITFEVAGGAHLGMVNPKMCGEFSVASDNTIYGLIHSVDLGIPAVAAAEMGEEMLFLNGLSDIPFSMRVYSDDEVLAIKSVTFGIPYQVMAATDGEFSEILVYAQTMVTGQYSAAE